MLVFMWIHIRLFGNNCVTHSLWMPQVVVIHRYRGSRGEVFYRCCELCGVGIFQIRINVVLIFTEPCGVDIFRYRELCGVDNFQIQITMWCYFFRAVWC